MVHIFLHNFVHGFTLLYPVFVIVFNRHVIRDKFWLDTVNRAFIVYLDFDYPTAHIGRQAFAVDGGASH